MDAELDAFKRAIDLRAYAAAEGYELDRKASWTGSSVMRCQTRDDKIIVKRGSDGHYVFFSVKQNCSGTIIDFAQGLKSMSLGALRKELRPWLSSPPVPVPVFEPLPKTSKDRLKVETEYARMREALRHPYLENERALPPALLALSRFAGRIRIDTRGNAVFPHFDQQGLCGYEIKNKNFTGFSKGGTKGLWFSHYLLDDRRIVFCESTIDALSHAALYPDIHARYASIGGQVNPLQPELIRAAIARLPIDSEVVAAMDADAQGGKLAAMVRKALELTGRKDLRFAAHEPFGFKDWNDELKAKRPLPFSSSYRPEVPSAG